MFNSRNKTQFFKVLLGIMLVGLVFSTLGNGNLSTVHAYEGAPIAPPIDILYIWSPLDNIVLYWSLNLENGGPGLRPYDLNLYNVQTDNHYILASGGYGGVAKFAKNGTTISFWYDNLPYIVNLDNKAISAVSVETDNMPVKGAFSSNNEFLIYTTETHDVRMKDLNTNIETSLGEFNDVSTLPYLLPEWSPNDEWVAFGTESNGILIDPLGTNKPIGLSSLTLPQSEFSSAMHYFVWSNNSNALYNYTGELLYTFTSKGEPLPDLELQNSSFDGMFKILVSDGELFLYDTVSDTQKQLTTNGSTLERMFALESKAPSTDMTTQAVADGFDYPVGKPDMAGYNTTAGCWWLQTTGACAPGPHPGQDFNGNGGGDSDLGNPVYAVANGTVVFSGVGSGTSWGNIIMIEHTLPDGSRVWSQYAHLQNRNISSGTVNKGDQIGTIGKGYNNIYYAHLHFEIRIQYRAADAWISGWSVSQVEQYYVKPEDFINSHRTIGGGETNNPPAGFTWCADEGGTCSFSGTADVVYGARNSFTSPRSFTNSVACNNDVFGDPISGVGKACYYKMTTVTPDHSVQFYKDWHYEQGYCYADSAGSYGNIDGCSGYDQNISSVLLKSGWSVRVYKERDLGGPSKCFTSNDDDFSNDTFDDGSGLNDQVSSFDLYNQSSCPSLIPPPPSLGSPGNGSTNPYNYDLNFQWNSSSRATEYLLEWWGGPYSAMQPCGWSSSTSCHVGTIAAGNTYSWHVKARNSTGTSDWSDTWTFTIQPNIPNTPPNLRVSGSTQTSVTIAWDDVSNETGYKIYEWNGSSFVYLASVGANVTSYTDTRSTCGWDEYYEVSAYNGNGESDHAGWVYGSTQACPPPPPSLISPGDVSINPYNYDLNFQWNSSSGATEYLIEWWGGPYAPMQPCGWRSSTSCHVGVIAAGHTYSWHVKARNSAGESAWSNTWTFTIEAPYVDLVPYPREGRQDPVIASSAGGTTTNDTLYAGQDVFFDWGYKNVGNAGISTNYYVDLLIDDQRIIHYPFSALGAGGLGGFDDWQAMWNTGGWHTVKLVVDPDNTVVESNENNNVWEKQFYWEPRFFSLTVNKTGAGSGTVTSIPTGINCGSTCSYQFNANLDVTLTATADLGSTFTGWSGDTDCLDGQVTMDASKTCTATFQTPPGPFNKTSPADGATNQPYSLYLRWEASSGVQKYEYCLSTSPSTCTTWISRGTAQTALRNDLAPSTTYYWQVRAVNTAGTIYANGSETSHWSFTTAPVEAFNKTSPANGAVNQPLSLYLRWGASTGVQKYEYCLSTSVATCTTWIPRGTATTAARNDLAPNTTYYWQVRAVSSVGTTYANGSETAHWSFTTGSLPGDFNKTSPADGATNQSQNLYLRWGASSGIQRYEYCISTSAATCTVWIKRGTARTAALSDLAPDTTYYWQVRAVNSIGTTYANDSETAYWSFTTGSIPGDFNKTSPLNGATNQPRSLYLRWGASPGAQRYEYCLSTSAATCTTWISRGTATTAALSGLLPNTTYYWQVRAVSSYGTTYANGSAPAHWSFTTGP